MMQALHWLFQQTGNAVEAGVEACYLCGASCAQTHHVGKAIADTFNSHFLARRRSSSYLCDACAWYLDSKAGHPDFRKWSRQIIEDALAKGGQWYLGFSGGVDSTVVLHMLYSQGHQADVCWGDNGWDFPETLQFLRDTEAHYGIHIRRYRTVESFQDFAREMGRPDLAEYYDAPGAWDNPREWDAIHLLKDTSFEGYDGVFLGLLGTRGKHGGESRARFLQLRGGHRPLYRSASDRGTWHCSPLAAWTKRDVWAYITKYNVPYNPVYDSLARLGVPLERRRCTELTCYRVAQYGSFVYIKAGWPDLYNRFAALFPEVHLYA